MHENIPGIITTLTSRYNDLAASLKIKEKSVRLKELETLMEAMDFWNNQERAKEVVAELKSLKLRVTPAQKTAAHIEELTLLWEMGCEAGDDATKAEADAMITPLQIELDKLETSTLLGGKYDPNNCFLTLQSGAGGTEADDWCEMMHRMYIYYCESMGFKLTEVEKNNGTEAGLKDVTLYVEGEMAYGYLSAERGTHRLARVSPFNAEGKRQTSFCTVDVTPEFPESDEDIINPLFLETIPFVRASGPGGQNVNKVATAIRLVYKTPQMTEPIMVVCSGQRKQEQNKKQAMSILTGKLELMEEERKRNEKDAASGGAVQRGWGSQIRSYVFYDNRVKDHRTNYEESNPPAVLNGRLQGFVEAELRRRANERA